VENSVLPPKELNVSNAALTAAAKATIAKKGVRNLTIMLGSAPTECADSNGIYRKLPVVGVRVAM